MIGDDVFHFRIVNPSIQMSQANSQPFIASHPKMNQLEELVVEHFKKFQRGILMGKYLNFNKLFKMLFYPFILKESKTLVMFVLGFSSTL